MVVIVIQALGLVEEARTHTPVDQVVCYGAKPFLISVCLKKIIKRAYYGIQPCYCCLYFLPFRLKTRDQREGANQP